MAIIHLHPFSDSLVQFTLAICWLSTSKMVEFTNLSLLQWILFFPIDKSSCLWHYYTPSFEMRVKRTKMKIVVDVSQTKDMAEQKKT